MLDAYRISYAPVSCDDGFSLVEDACIENVRCKCDFGHADVTLNACNEVETHKCDSCYLGKE